MITTIQRMGVQHKIKEWLEKAVFSDDITPACRDLVAWRMNGQYAKIDAALASMDVGTAPTSLIIGVLTATAACAVYLNARVEFFAQAKRVLGKRRKGRLLKGLECTGDED